MNQKNIGILLAGGMSRRFGKPKAFQEVDGRMFYEHACAALEGVCDDIIIVTRAQFIERFSSSYQTVVDLPEYDGCGPMAGIYTAMTKMKADKYIVMPCDMPLINANIIQNLFNHHQQSVTVVNTEEKLQPLVSVWNQSCEAVIRETLDQQDYAMTAALKKLKVHEIASNRLTDEPERFMNINTAGQYKELTEWLKS